MAEESVQPVVQDVNQEAPQTGDIDKLFNVVSSKGLYTKSKDEFIQKYSTPENIDKLFQVVSDKGLYTKSKGDFYSKYYPNLSSQPKTEQQVQPIQNAININQPTPIIQNVPKETSPYLKGLDFKTITDAIKADKSQQEQQNSTIGALYNSVVGGLGEAATGFLNRAAQSVPSSMGSVGGAPSGTMAGTTEDRAMAAKGIALATSDLIDKARTNASSRENEQSFNFDTNKGIIHNAKSLAFQLPRLAVDLGLGALTGGGSFFAQGEGAALEELKNNPEADKLTPNTQAGYVTTVGIVNGVLMKLGFDKIFKATGLEDLAAKRIINEVTSDLVKKGVKATTKDIEDAALRKATSFMTKANNVGIGALKSTLTGGGIGVVQAASDDAIKLLVDKASGVDVFNSEDIKENFPKHLLTSVIQGGATGLVMGLGHGMFENTNKAIRLKMAEAKTPQDIENIKQNINQQVESGNITPEQAQAANIKIQDYAQIAAKIPEEITSDRKYAIIGGIEQREGIKNEIQSTQDELNSTDEAFQSDKNAKLELLNAKLLQTNDYIDGLVTGEKTKYSEENGVYYKTDANGDKIPISKQHYELGSAAEKNDKKQTTQVQQPTETQKPTIETIGEVKPTTEKTETKELADKDLIPAYNKAEGFIIGDEARKSVGDVIGKINNAEYINENELDNASNHLYDLLDKHGDNKSFANLIEPLIHKIESYDFRTKSETSTVTERQATQVARPTREKTIANKSLEQWEGSNATITDEAGKTTKGKIKSENGKYYLYDNEGNKIHSIGEKALTDKHISIPSLEDVPNPVVFNENGTATVTLQLNKVDTERGGVYPNKKIKIEFNNPDKALDLAVQLRAEQIGEIPQPEFDTVYDEVQKEVTKEVPVKNLSKEKTAQKEVAPKVETKVTPTKTEPKEEKTAADTVHDDLLTHLGITEEPKGETKPAKKYTSKNIDTISEEGLNDTQKKVVKDVKNVVKAVSKLVEKTTGNPLEVNIHETPSSYEKAVIDAGGTKQDSTSKGFYLDADGTIHLNMERVTTDTMLHEGFHPVLDYMAKNRPDIIDNLHSQLEGLKGGKEVIDNANKLYEGSDATTIKKEAITDFIAKVADGTIKIDKTNFQKVKDFFVNSVNKLGFKLGKDINTITDLKKLAELVSEKFNKGEEIEIKDGSKANSSERVQFQSDFKHQESGIEWKYFKNSKEFKKLVDDGYVTFDKNIDDFKGAVVLHAPDAGFSGQILKDGQLIADGKGGMYYPMVFHENGDFWAATSRGASKLAETLNEARKKSPDGKVRMVLISAPIDKLMSSSLNGIGLVDILTSKAFSEKSGITPEQLRKAIIKGIKTTEKLKNENKDGMKPSQKPLPKITGNETMADLHIKLKDFYPAENSDFPVRKSLNQNILEGIASYSSSPKVAKQLSEFLGAGTFNEKLKSTGGKLSRANLTQGFSNILAEPTLRGEQSGKMYAIIELGADVKPVKTSEHESYPYTLRSTDANEKPTIHILSKRDYWYNHVNDENGNSIADNKEKQASMLPASAGISSVVDLNPTKTEGVSPLVEKAKPKQPIEEFGLGYAPYRERNVYTLDQDKKIRNSASFKLYQENVKDLAKLLNINISDKLDTWGGYVDFETNRGVQEVSNIIRVLGTKDDVRLMAAAMGKIAPQMQDSILAGTYDANGEGIEHIIKTGNFDNANKALKYFKEHDLQYFSIDKKTGNIIIIDFDNSNSDNIINFTKKLNENGIKTEHEAQRINAEFIESKDYDGILNGEGSKIGDKNRGDINAFIEDAKGKHEKIAEKEKNIQFSKEDQDSKIKDFIEIQRQKGISDKDIQAGLEKASEKIGIDKAKIDELMSTPKVEQTGDLQSQYDGIKSEKAKKKFITKNFGEVSEEQLSDIVKNNTDLQTIKDKIDAIQKSGAGEVLQPAPQGNGSKGGKRGGMEQGEQGAEATTKKNGEENGDGQRVGISHKSLTELADKLGLEQPERGDVLTPEEYSERGKLLIKNGADPIKVAEEFKKDNKVNSDIISVARAHFNELVRDVNDARIKFGIDSEEYKKSLKEAKDWAKNVVKPMGTAFGEIGRSLQGQVDLDTGNFVSVSMAVQEKTGKDLSTEQTKEVERLTTNVSDLNKKIQDLEKKLTDTISKGEEAKPKAKEGIKEKSKEIANVIRKGKLSKPDIFSSASPASLVWDAAIEITAKTVEVSGDIAQAIADGLEHIKNSDWYKNSDSDKQKAAQKAFRDFVQNQDIKIRFAEKKDNKFTTEEAKSIWEYAKEEYLDKGSDYREMLNGVSKDLGLNRDQIRTAISQPKGAKEITDEMYRNINKRNSAINEAKQWVEEQGNSKTKNFLKAVPSAFFKLKTFGHGTVGGITHAGTNIFQISKWKSYFPFFAKQFKYAFGDTAKYEMAMEDLKNDPQFTFWQRAGLAVDPKVKYDDYQGNFVDGDKKVNGIKKLFNRLGVTGDRGFNALKVYRLDLAKGFYDRLSNEEKADPNTAKEIAKLVNHSTGTSELDLGRGGVSKFVSTAFFAPKLEASRWQGLIGDPVKAAKTFTNWKESSPAEKAGAKLVARNAGEKIATYVALLAANSALLSLMGSKQKINYTNPLSSDWLKFKTGGGKTLDITGGTLASMKLLGTLIDNTVIGVTGTKKELWKKPAEKDYQAIGTQLRYKLSPFASTIADLVETTDAMGRPLPYSNIKPKKGETKYTYLSYVGQQQTPIPISAGIREAIGSMKERGMTNIQIQDVLMGTLYFTVEGFTGAKLGNEPKKKK